jgi:hypothetical protein
LKAKEAMYDNKKKELDEYEHCVKVFENQINKY